MQRTKKDNDFIKFLKNEKFIEWKLFPTSELNSYWENFIQQYPWEKENIEIAEQHFENIKLSSYKLSKDNKEAAKKHLEFALSTYRKKKNIRYLLITAAATIAILIGSILFLQKYTSLSEQDIIATADFIVGNELDSEDILFITGNKSTTFNSNVDIHIEENNTAQITHTDKKAEKIKIEEKTMNKLIVPYGKRSKLVLSDGTQVWLNSGSSLEFPSNFSKDSRDIYLNGEIYIEVATEKNRPFYVHTPDYNVRVYGTKFNVSSYTGVQSSVVLVEGSVGLSIDTKKEELKLSPNEQAIFYNETKSFETKEVDIEKFTSWKDGYLTFKDTPVTEVLKQIERYYNLSFEYENDISFKDKTCTGKIILSDNIDNVMSAMALISDTKYQLINNQIYIYK